VYQSSIVLGFIFVCLLFSKQIVTVGKVEIEKPLFPFSIVISNPFLNTAAGLVVLFTWTLVFAHVANKMAIRDYEHINRILTNDCDPERFINALSKQFHINHMSHKGLYNAVMLNICTGLGAAGRYEEMRNALNQIVIPKGRRWLPHKFTYAHNLLVCCLELGDKDSSQKYMAEMKSILENEKFPKKLLQQYKEIYLQDECLRGINQDSSEEEQNLKERFSNAKNQIQKVAIQFSLGAFYLKQSEKEQARQAFNYVIDYGNKLAVVAKARKCLEELEKATTDGNVT
jgi:hypothetical protein